MMTFSEPHLRQLHAIVLDYAGILLERVSVRKIASKVARHMAELSIQQPEDYLYLLTSKSGEWALHDLMARITVSESFFFRNPGQFRYLAREFLPALVEKNTQNSLRILSAGCASGEETYSLAAILHQFRQSHLGLRLFLTGVDISPLNIKRANEGRFRESSFRDQSREIIREFHLSFFTNLKGEHVIDEQVRRLVSFQLLNLKDEFRLKRFIGSDIIMCRNVLIYFPDPFRQRLIELFHLLLNPGGMLFLGETESLHIPSEGFEMINCCGAYGYRKVASPQA